MHNKYLRLAAIFGGLAVAIGAFGAHGLKKLTTDPTILDGFSTGAEYQMYHSLALLGIAIIMGKNIDRRFQWAANCFIAGIVFFSGSLYGLTFLKIYESPYASWLGPITPLGGVMFILGWGYIIAVTLTRKGSERKD